jgi:hypothetical protein
MNIYKLKSGKTSGAFQLPLRGILVTREIKGENYQKEIQYVPGANSFYKEDHKGDTKPRPLWFDDGEIRVNPDDKVLNELLQAHPWFNTKYYLVNEEAAAKEEIDNFEKITIASNSIIEEKDNLRLKAMAMIIISLDAANWDPFKCKAELLKYARNHSTAYLKELNKKNFDGRFMAALAFTKGIVKYNAFQTAVLWNEDNEGVIVRVAEGENGIDKFGEFLATKTEKSTAVLQRIGEKVDVLEATTNVGTRTADNTQNAPAKTEAQIREEVREEERQKVLADLAKEDSKKSSPDGDFGPIGQAIQSDEGAGSKKESEYDSTNIDSARAKYLELFGKEVANLKKNDLDWINNQILTKLT